MVIQCVDTFFLLLLLLIMNANRLFQDSNIHLLKLHWGEYNTLMVNVKDQIFPSLIIPLGPFLLRFPSSQSYIGELENCYFLLWQVIIIVVPSPMCDKRDT